MVFLRQTRPKPSFCEGKVGFFYEKPSFYVAKPKKTSFSKPPPHSLKKMVFLGVLVLPRKRWFCIEKPTFTSQKDGFPEAGQAKTIFLRGKSWFFYEKPSFYEAKPKNHLFQHPLPILLKSLFLWFFGFARLGVQSCGPCGVCFVERQPLRVAKNGIGHERAFNGIYEGNRSG